MSFISNLFGGGSNGQDFAAKNPFTSEQQQQAIKDSQAALQQQNAFVQQLQGQGGLQNQANTFNQMQGTAQDLQAAARGEGANPAQAQLAQATGANVANQAALMAGQRGASANAGMMARQAAQQGAGIQQNAAGQAATLGAQQQIAARQQLQQQQQMMGGMANQQVGQVQTGMANAGQMAGANQTAMLGAQANQNSTQAQIAAGNAQRQGGAMAGLLGAAGTALAGPLGGVIGGLFSGGGGAAPVAPGTVSQGAAPAGRQVPMMASGGEVPQTGADIVRPDKGWGKVTVKLAAGGEVGSGPKSHHGKYLNMQTGGPVPGKAAVAGDSLKNDTQPALLSPGEVVIPRHIMQGKDAPKKAAEFVAAIMARHGSKK